MADRVHRQLEGVEFLGGQIDALLAQQQLPPAHIQRVTAKAVNV